jgi:hypothetical protein
MNLLFLFVFKRFQALVFIIILSAFDCSIAQTTARKELQSVLNDLSKFTKTYAPEKIYLQTDKPDYFAGDTLWYKSYLFDADYLTASRKSNVLYIEIYRGNEFVCRRLTRLNFGLGSGNLYLDAKLFPPGDYVLRAYTNWLRNFNHKYLYERTFRIYGFNSRDLLVSSSAALQTQGTAQVADVKLKIADLTGKPLAFQDFSIRVNKGKQRGSVNRLTTGVDGQLKFTFPLSSQTEPENFTLSLSTGKDQEQSDLLFPLLFTDTKVIDIQFLPEGGNLVNGIKNKVAFKAIGQDGLGKNVSGIIVNRNGQTVADFRSDYLGMGVLQLTPQPGEVYTARINFSDGSSKSVPLPVAKPAGILLKVINDLETDSITVKILATEAFKNQRLFLIGQSRGVGCFGAPVLLRDSVGQFKISKSTFPQGIARLTILDTAKSPLAERAFFNNRSSLLNLRIEAHKGSYSNRDSVSMTIRVTDQDNRPVQGSFSIAVTDDDQVRIDSLGSRNLISDLLLSSDLKGHVENPGYYFPEVMTTEIWKRLDNLILTQGWVGFSWETIRQAKLDTTYQHESSFDITGKVNNLYTKPIKNGNVILFSANPVKIIHTTTDDAGLFRFKDVHPNDSTIFFAQARNKNSKNFGLAVLINDFKSPTYPIPYYKPLPWFLNLDTTSTSLIAKRLATLRQQEKISGKNLLKEVVIVGRKVISGSQNLNGPGEADFTISTEELVKAKKLSLRDLLMERLKGFHLNLKGNYYKLNGQRVHLIIDGVNVNIADPEVYPTAEMFDPFLNYLLAEDIKGIEVMQLGKNLNPYASAFLDPIQNANPMLQIIQQDHAFIEVTTYSGKGVFMVKVPGTAVFKPEPFASTRQFYSPKYTSKSTSPLADFRSTVYWNSNLITDKTGTATVSFYTTDKAGSYSVIVEGTDLVGGLGSSRNKLRVDSR